jgi:RNA polymerase sigma factor (sigma-70 family)
MRQGRATRHEPRRPPLFLSSSTLAAINAFGPVASRHPWGDVVTHECDRGTRGRLSNSPESLVEVGDVVRRTLAARTRDRHLVEDLTQETLVRVAAAEHRLSPDEQRAYAVVTARNLLTSHARGQSVQRRHIHRLVDHVGLDGPEQLTLEREETDALVVALERIDADDRDLLLRHEADGTDLATLADQAHVTSGAIGMRLARARAALRLEFLLAFRRIQLPTDTCRPVLLALSAGDRRRQAKLDAAGHLDTCPTCAALAKPITERNRRIAGWLLVPVAEGIRRAWRTVRNYPIHTAAVGVVAAATAVLPYTPRHQHESEAPAATAAAGPVTAVPAAEARPATTAVAVPPAITAAEATPATTAVAAPAVTAPAAPVTAIPAAEARPATTVAATPTTASVVTARSASTAVSRCPDPAPLDELDPTGDVGCPIAPTILTATDVPADEGFWATTTAQQTVWIHLVGRGESPIDVDPGHQLSVTGRIATPRTDPAQMGLPVEGDPRAAAIPFYLRVAYADVRFAN